MFKNKEANYKAILAKYMPAAAVDPIYSLITNYKVQLRIKKTRKTKLGDYRPPLNQSFHRISINNNLNPYAFVITLVHEIAHLEVWETYGKKVLPHGNEWKKSYTNLMEPFLNDNCFPADLNPVIIKHLSKGYASTSSDVYLTRALSKYDKEDTVLIEDIPEFTMFTLNDGRHFRKKHRLRKRYVCFCLNDKKTYLFSPAARVTVQTKK